MNNQGMPPPAGFVPVPDKSAPYPVQPGYPQQPFVGYPQQQQQVPMAGYGFEAPPAYAQQPQMTFTNQGFIPPQTMHPVMFAQGMPKDENEAESGKDLTSDWTGFSNKAIRALFVRKVYAILMLQLVFTLGVVCLFVFEDHVRLFVRQNIFIYIIAYVLFFAVYIALACCGNLRRQYPTNVIMLSIFTVTMSYMLGVISSFHETQIVLMAVGICAAVCLAVSLFSFHTKFDFTTCGGVLFVLCFALFIFGIIAIFTYNSILQTIYAGCGALLFTAFLAYDTQMIMGGKKHEMDPEEHIFAAICLYLDVVYIFMFILMAFGGKK